MPQHSSNYCDHCQTIVPNGSGTLCPRCVLDSLFSEELADSEDASLIARRYRIVERISSGGMGVVYRAHDTELDRDIALKILHPTGELNAPNEARFQTEIELIASLHHANIVPIYDYGKADGRAFFTMRLVQGKNLAEYVKDSGLTQKRAATIIGKIANAIEHAHSRGILHRDIKPSNILVDELGEPCLIDFSLAKKLDGTADLTISGTILGTPAFMSPEQASGHTHELTPTTDVYGLGATLYYSLTKRPPFNAPTQLGALQEIAEVVPPSPSSVSPEIDRDLSIICLHCLEKAPNQRYGSAAELATDLDNWQRGLPIVARPVSLPGRFSRWARREPILASLTATVLLAMFIILGLTLSSRQRLGAERQRFASLIGKTRIEKADRYVAAGKDSEAIATLAANIRDRTDATKSLDYLLTLIENRSFATRLGTEIEHNDEVWDVAFHPDGERIASACYDGSARIWSIATGKETTPPLRHGDQAYKVDFSPDGARLVSAAFDGTAQVWDSTTGRPIGKPLRHEGGIHVANFDPTGSYVITSCTDGAIRIWHADGSGLAFPELNHPKDDMAVHIALFGPKDNQVLSGSVRGRFRIWSLPTGKLVRTVDSGTDYTSEIFLSPDKQYCIFAGRSRASLVDTRTWNHIRWLEHREPVWSAAFESNGQHAITISADAINMWRLPEGTLSRSILGRSMLRSRLLTIPKRNAFVWFDDNTVYGAAFASLQPIFASIRFPFPIHRVEADPKRQRLAVTLRNHRLSIWEISEMKSVENAFETPHGMTYDQARFIHDSRGRLTLALGKTREPKIDIIAYESEWSHTERIDLENPLDRFLNMSETGRLAYLDITEEEVVHFHDPGEHSNKTLASNRYLATLASHPTNPLYVIGEQAGFKSLRVCDKATNQFVGKQINLEATPSVVAIHPTEALMVVGYLGGGLALWDIGNQTQLDQADDNWGRTNYLQFSPDGRRVVSATEDGVVRVWESQTRLALQWEGRMQSDVRVLSMTSDSQQLAAGSSEGDVLLWDLHTGSQETFQFRHQAEIIVLEYLPESRTLLVASRDHVLRFWDTSRGIPLTEPRPFAGNHEAIDVTPNGQFYCQGVIGGSIVIRETPKPRAIAGVPDWIVPLTETITGLRLTAEDTFEAVSWEERFAHREALTEGPGVNILPSN